MSKISEQAAEAFMGGYYYANSHTMVLASGNTENTLMYLHSNLIATKLHNNISITNANWSTVTTKSRLNSIPGVHIYQKDNQWFLNNKEWNGDWIQI
jgi:hypothetical protein